ncbi:hypothetical protein EMIT0P2_50199 [Pseudomonas sp. IT-P2]
MASSTTSNVGLIRAASYRSVALGALYGGDGNKKQRAPGQPLRCALQVEPLEFGLARLNKHYKWSVLWKLPVLILKGCWYRKSGSPSPKKPESNRSRPPPGTFPTTTC